MRADVQQIKDMSALVGCSYHRRTHLIQDDDVVDHIDSPHHQDHYQDIDVKIEVAGNASSEIFKVLPDIASAPDGGTGVFFYSIAAGTAFPSDLVDSWFAALIM